MATLNTSSGRSGSKSRTLQPTIDLTAMVDLAFLLITFFMLTTSLAKYKAMDLAKPVPVKDVTQLQPYPASRTLTLLLGNNHQAGYFMGEANKADVQTADLLAIGKRIEGFKKRVASTHSGKGQGLIVVIKPSAHSTYKDLVDALDEMKIHGIVQYAVEDKYFQKEELAYLARQK